MYAVSTATIPFTSPDAPELTFVAIGSLFLLRVRSLTAILVPPSSVVNSNIIVSAVSAVITLLASPFNVVCPTVTADGSVIVCATLATVISTRI